MLVTTLTKRMAEELTEYYGELGVKVRYLHSDVKTIERMDIIRELREGAFDVLVGDLDRRPDFERTLEFDRISYEKKHG